MNHKFEASKIFTKHYLNYTHPNSIKERTREAKEKSLEEVDLILEGLYEDEFNNIDDNDNIWYEIEDYLKVKKEIENI